MKIIRNKIIKHNNVTKKPRQFRLAYIIREAHANKTMTIRSSLSFNYNKTTSHHPPQFYILIIHFPFKYVLRLLQNMRGRTPFLHAPRREIKIQFITLFWQMSESIKKSQVQDFRHLIQLNSVRCVVPASTRSSPLVRLRIRPHVSVMSLPVSLRDVSCTEIHIIKAIQ